MPRESRTKTHFENLVIVPKTPHGDAAGDIALQVLALDQDVNGAPTSSFSVSNTGVVVGKQTIATQISPTAALSAAAGTIPDSVASGSVFRVTHATPNITLPAVASTAGVSLTIVNGGAGTTSFTITAATACIVANALDSASLTCATLVWSTALHIIGAAATFVSDGIKWMLVSSSTTPTSHT